MEEFYPPENYGASIQFPLKRYFEEFSETFPNATPFSVLQDEENEAEYLSTIGDLMKIDLDFKSLKELAETCSSSRLTCKGENVKNLPTKLPNNINSGTKLPNMIFTTPQENELEVSKCKVDAELKKRSYHEELGFKVPSGLPDLKTGSDFVVSILVYKPFEYKYFNSKNTSEKLRFNHEILALGINTLADLRDAIVCPSDEGLCKEVLSTSDDLIQLGNPKEIYPSGFIFIDNVFYNDYRAENAIDYSTPIIEWAKEKIVKNLNSASIEGVRIDSLTPRFGYPYLYMHQGNCEHILAFSDARLLNQDDCLHSKCYPHVLRLNRKNNNLCFLCTVTLARWICVGSDRFPQHKVFLCTDCCNSYNYINGKKLGKFKLYPLYQRSANTCK